MKTKLALRSMRVAALSLAWALTYSSVPAAELTRDQALAGLSSGSPQARRGAAERLGAVGRMGDSRVLADLLRDPDGQTRAAAEAALWKVWGKSGDARIDALYERGVSEMNAGAAQAALVTFNEIVRRKPEFAEGWNKRATVLYFLGRYKESLADCDQVMKRNPLHFGALSGYGQIYLQLDDGDLALAYFEKALAVNPNLPCASITIRQLQQQLQEKQRKST